MTEIHVDIDIAIVSLFCAGGLFAYVREAMRLRRLINTGRTTIARIVDKKMDDAGSESVVHYWVKYEFVDAEGRRVVHDQDINSKRFFDTLRHGDTIEVLYSPVTGGASYPVSQVSSDMKKSALISLAILIFWTVMVIYFVQT